jgi:F-type H+-transporting ATPase subunit b
LRARAAADVEAAKVSAIADLRAEVASLAIGAAETIVQKNLDRETQVQLVENYINQVGSRQ